MKNFLVRVVWCGHLPTYQSRYGLFARWSTAEPISSNHDVKSLVNTSTKLRVRILQAVHPADLIVGHVYQKLNRRKLDLMLTRGLFRLDVSIDHTASVSIKSPSLCTLPVIIFVAICSQQYFDEIHDKILLQTLLCPAASMRVNPADHMAPHIRPRRFHSLLGLVSLLWTHVKSWGQFTQGIHANPLLLCQMTTPLLSWLRQNVRSTLPIRQIQSSDNGQGYLSSLRYYYLLSRLPLN